MTSVLALFWRRGPSQGHRSCHSEGSAMPDAREPSVDHSFAIDCEGSVCFCGLNPGADAAIKVGEVADAVDCDRCKLLSHGFWLAG